MASILSGNEYKEYILKQHIEYLRKINKKLKLVVIRVGDNPASKIYVNSKKKACKECGIDFEEIHFDNNIEEEALIQAINNLNNDTNVTSILVQLPLPKPINVNKVINTINYKKDVDGLTLINQSRLLNNMDCIIPCTANGIINLLNYYNLPIEGQNVTIIGRSNLVGKPLAIAMENRNATVTLCHSKTKKLSDHTKNANIIVVAVGKVNLIKKDMLQDNQIIIDVGINRENDKITGDVDFENVKTMDIKITPVPGGVGPLTIASVITNIIKCYELQKNEQ